MRTALRKALTSNRFDLALHRLAFAKNWNSHLRFRLPGYPYKYQEFGSQHGFWKGVPDNLRKLKLVSPIRDPVDWAFSHYKFGVTSKSLVESKHVSQDAVSDFDDFLEAWDKSGNYTNHAQNEGRVGNLSAEFICCFLDIEDRPKVFEQYPNIDLMCEVMRSLMPDVHFLRNERLNDELAAFLQKMGYPSLIYDAVKSQERVNVSRRTAGEITNCAREFIGKREAFLYRMFPEYTTSL